MSEQPNNVIQFPGGREGTAFGDTEVQLDFHKHTVPKYNQEAIMAARKAVEQHVQPEVSPVILEIQSAARNLSNLTAIRRHELGGEAERRAAS